MKHITQAYWEPSKLLRPLRVLFTIKDYKKQIVSNSQHPHLVNNYSDYKEFCIRCRYEYQEARSWL